MLKLIIGLVLLGHGIGHSLGLLQVFKVAAVNPEWHGESWLLTSVAGASATQAIGAVIWTAAIVGFTALAAVVFGWLPLTWWQPLAIGSAIVSMIGLLLFPIAFPTFSTLGAVAVNAAVLVAVIWYHWAPSDLAA